MYENKKHLLIICPFAHPNLGGVETHIDKLLSYAGKKGYFTTLLTYQPLTRDIKAPSYEKHGDHEIWRVNWFGTGWFPKLENYFPLMFMYLFPGIFFKSLFYYLKNSRNIDVIHAHGLVSALAARIITLFGKVRTVVSTHAVYNFDKRPVLNFLVRQILIGFDKVLAVSEVSKQELIQMGIPKDSVEVHPNWVDTDVFCPRDQAVSKQKLNMNFDTNILFVGRLLEKKGVLLITEAAKRLPNIGFHIVGNGPLEEHIKNLNLSNVTYHGVLLQTNLEHLEKLLNLYSACDYFASPYLYDEGFSATLIESVACGVPVIISDRGSPPTFLSEEVAVFLPKIPTSTDLEKLLLTLSPRTYELTKLCRDFAQEHFGFKNADIIIKSYEG